LIDGVVQQIDSNIREAIKQGTEESDEVKMVKEIGDIFIENGLETDLTDLMKSYDKKLDEMVKEYDGYKLKLKQLRDLNNTIYEFYD